MSTYIFSKTPQETCEVTVDLSSLLASNIVNTELLSIYPDTGDNTLKASITTENKQLYIKLTDGEDGTTYGLTIAVTGEKEETKVITVAVNVSSNSLFDYQQVAPDSFMDLIGTIQAGSSAISHVSFKLPCDINTQNGYVTWELFDVDSNVLSSGNAYSYAVDNDGITSNISAECLITVPSDVAPTLQNTRYQIRYCLTVDNNTYYQFEALSVEGTYTVPIGITDTVELQGTKTCMQIIVPQAVDTVKMEVYKDNQLLTSLDLSNNGERVATGWKYGGYIDTTNMEISLENYTVVFKYKNTSSPNDTYQESAKLWVVNPSILSAARDILEKINKARMTLYGAPDLVYTMPCIMTWLRRGADRFNGSYGIFTSFTFTNAKGGVREYWLMWTELMALESQYLAEGEKAFDFQGAAISLNVDRTQYLESVRGNLQSALDNEFKPFKQNLLIKGNTSGDGSSGDGSSGGLAPGSMGAIGITITPATGWGRYYPGNYYTKWF